MIRTVLLIVSRYRDGVSFPVRQQARDSDASDRKACARGMRSGNAGRCKEAMKSLNDKVREKSSSTVP